MGMMRASIIITAMKASKISTTATTTCAAPSAHYAGCRLDVTPLNRVFLYMFFRHFAGTGRLWVDHALPQEHGWGAVAATQCLGPHVALLHAVPA